MPLGLVSLCLALLLTSCASEPTLQAVYVAVPVTSNLDLLCKPKAPPLPPSSPSQPLQNETLARDYVHQLLDVIDECARQQQEYRDELDRLVKRAKQRNSIKAAP